MKNQILSAINGRMTDSQKVLDRTRSSMQQDFMHFFCFESIETYRAVYMLARLEGMKQAVEETQTVEELAKLVKLEMESYLRRLTDAELFASTSSQMVNISRNIEVEAAQILHRFYANLYHCKLKNIEK